MENRLKEIIESDAWMLSVLKTVRELGLSDCWIGAGFVRNKVWDELHQMERTALNDIDVIYYNSTLCTKEQDKEIENKLKKDNPTLNWSVKNQARMNIRNGHKPYLNCEDAISFWPETATSIAVRLSKNNKIELIAPYGLADLFNLKVVPTPKFNLAIYTERMNKKKWNKKWPKLNIKTQNEHQ